MMSIMHLKMPPRVTRMDYRRFWRSGGRVLWWGRHQQRAECWKTIKNEWDEFTALEPNTDQDKQITAMKNINKKIRMVEKI